MNKQKVLGFDVDIISFDDAIKKLVSAIQNKQGTHVITINPEIIETALKNEQLSQIIKNSELVVADGTGIKIALKLKKINQERIPGIDLAYRLLEQSNTLGFKIAMIGAKQEVIVGAKENLKKQFNNLNICYFHNGYFSSEQEGEIIQEIKSTSPDIVLVALGSPKQEFFIQNCRNEISNAVYIGIGGSFDVWAGVVERAPEFFRLIYCEWLYRTFKQPQRIKRIYKTLPHFFIKVIIDAIKYNIQKRDINDK